MNNEVNHFFGCEDFPAAKAKYKALAKALHPDKQGGSEERFKMMAAEYERIQQEDIWPVPRKGEAYSRRRTYANQGWPQEQQDAMNFMRDFWRQQEASKKQQQTDRRRHNPFATGGTYRATDSSFDPKQYYQWFTRVGAMGTIHGGMMHTLFWKDETGKEHRFTESEANRAIRHAFTKFGKTMHKEQLHEVLKETVAIKQKAATDPAADFIKNKRDEKNAYQAGDNEEAARIFAERIRQKPYTPDESFQVDPEKGDINEQLNNMNNATPQSEWQDLSTEEKVWKGFMFGAWFDFLK